MGRPKSYEREKVIECAMRLFWKKGYEGTHLDELVRVTGLNRFSLYSEFGGKEGLFLETLRFYAVGLSDLTQALEAQPLGSENIRRYFRLLVSDRFFHGCYLINTIRERHVVPRKAFHLLEQVLDRGRESFRKNLLAASERGQGKKAPNVEGLIHFLIAFEMGILTYGILSDGAQERLEAISLLDRVLP